ncbi:MAG: hypothetical protein A2289_03375 [Deltaproteobacteria bacterium RIFOXYA12_FULL_58_15]|nr:MAG: hypothetical protein A2289_03375 [Deltaproteobacteria bacterium RIFOXYA12_FULL_58_15]OGR08390.1 MAG: hypothetical protein A2341_17490 [Deltaproteobacteria bacterium RIFOXYB12_FULL_58_9]
MLMWPRILIVVALPVLAVTLASPAFAADEDESVDIPEVEDIEGNEKRLDILQNRKYEMLHEVTLLGGTFPADPFYKGVTATLGYTLHFNQVLAWEVLQFSYSFNIETKLKKDLDRVAAGQNQLGDEFPEIEWVVGSHLVLKPLYGKEALFNTKVVHLELHLMAGPAFVRRSAGDNPLPFGFDAGFGVRLWLEKWVCLRFDIMELVYFVPKPEQAIHLHVGVGFNLRGED